MADVNFILTKEYLWEIFEYSDGKLFWKIKKNGMVRKEAGWNESFGYRAIHINGKTYKAHKLIYFMFNNEYPKLIDHIDNNKINNKIENLRKATYKENSWNQKLRITNTSGYKGITWSNKANSWMARCMINGKSNFLGLFKEIEDANNCLIEFRKKHQGQFARNF